VKRTLPFLMAALVLNFVPLVHAQTTDLAKATEYCRTHPDNDLERLSGEGMCVRSQRAAVYCNNHPEGVYLFIACPDHAAAQERKKAEEAAHWKAESDKIQEEHKAQDTARDTTILWCEGQPANAPVDPSSLGFHANDFVGPNCGSLLEWVDRTQAAGLGAAFLHKAAQTDPVAKQRFDAWVAEQTRLKLEQAALEKRHAATLPLLHLGQTQAQVKAILNREGFEPWVCERLDPSQVNANPGETIVACPVSRKGVTEFVLLFSVSQRYGRRDPDTTEVTTWEVKTDRLTQIIDRVSSTGAP
jgi:hypothetical protein